MTDRPISFSAPMIRALLAGNKTQTRRLIKPQPDLLLEGQIPKQLRIQIDDRLWVKENFKVEGAVRCHQLETESGMEWDDGAALVRYDADKSSAMVHDLSINDKGVDESEQAVRMAKKNSMVPSIFMPRWASRLTLIITDVRVQRLQDISCADAIAEGIPPLANSATIDCDTPDPREDFARLWDSINKDRCPWSSNPWVVAYSFDVHRCNIDQMEGANG